MLKSTNPGKGMGKHGTLTEKYHDHTAEYFQDLLDHCQPGDDFSYIQPSTAQAQSQNGDGLKRRVNAESGKVSFIGPENGKLLSAPQAIGQFARPADPAMALAKKFGPEFGLKDPEKSLSDSPGTTMPPTCSTSS